MAEVERLHHLVAVLIGGMHRDRDGRVALGNLGQHLEPVPVRQAEIEEHQLHVRVLGELPHRLTCVRRLDDDGRLALQLLEDAAQGLADQYMVVDDKDLHQSALIAWAVASILQN
jgi:hypothetical protein